MTWLERLERAQTRGEFTAEDRRLAGDWNSCAVGEHLHAHASLTYGTGVELLIPDDLSLFQLGVQFCAEVTHDQVEEAKTTYSRITGRVTTLLQTQGASS